MAVSGKVDRSLADPTFHAAFKGRTREVVDSAYVDPVDGIYLKKGPWWPRIQTLIETGMDGTVIDPEAVFVDEEDPLAPAVPLLVTEMGIERDGFRGKSLVINASMGTEEAGWAGVYLTKVPK